MAEGLDDDESYNRPRVGMLICYVLHTKLDMSAKAFHTRWVEGTQRCKSAIKYANIACWRTLINQFFDIRMELDPSNSTRPQLLFWAMRFACQESVGDIKMRKERGRERERERERERRRLTKHRRVGAGSICLLATMTY